MPTCFLHSMARSWDFDEKCAVMIYAQPLLRRLLQRAWRNRCSAGEALRHPFFKNRLWWANLGTGSCDTGLAREVEGDAEVGDRCVVQGEGTGSVQNDVEPVQLPE